MLARALHSCIACIYDIHGNLPALEAVLADIRQSNVAAIVVGGDVLPGPMATECLDCLFALEIPVHFITGNGDRTVLEFSGGIENLSLPEAVRETIRWNAAELDDDHVQRIRQWPSTLQLSVSGIGNALFCHATPRNDTEIFSERTPDGALHKVFEGVSAQTVICGHTHMQFDRMVGNVRVVNAGSVGMPFGEPGAYWLKLGKNVELRRTDYDRARAAERIAETRYPGAADFAKRYVVHPPTEEQMLEVYAKSEIG